MLNTCLYWKSIKLMCVLTSSYQYQRSRQLAQQLSKIAPKFVTVYTSVYSLEIHLVPLLNIKYEIKKKGKVLRFIIASGQQDLCRAFTDVSVFEG